MMPDEERRRERMGDDERRCKTKRDDARHSERTDEARDNGGGEKGTSVSYLRDPRTMTK